MELSELHKAAYQGDLDKVKALVNSGCDINQKCPDEASPIMYAIVEYQFDVCQYLIEQGADLTLRDNDGADVYELAESWPDILELLVNATCS